ncbi:MAG: CAP domain-containing protein [bacterium]|nr:CAP domain-containing protein [bacterium]
MEARPKLLVLSALILVSGWGCQNFSLPTTSSNFPDNKPKPVLAAHISIADIIFETNNQRRANGLSSLIENSKLNTAADFKMRDMFTRQYFDHYAPDGTSGIPELLIRFDYGYMAAGENLALGNFKSASELVALWMASPGHRANILNGVYRDIGVATGYDMFEGRQTIIAVQIFGISR